MMFAKLRRRQRILSAICALLLAFLTLSSATAQAANSQPAFPSSENGARSVAENTAAGANIGAPVGATDADNDALTYTLGGDDAASFTIVPSTGQLQTLAALNFEDKDTYSVTVSASDRKDATGNPDTAIDVTIDVTISVTNVDEPGTVILSPAQPRVGEVLRARVSDPEGAVVSTGFWLWQKSRDGTTGWSNVQNSAPYPSSYEVQAADLNFYLRASVGYEDGHGSGKSANGVTGRVAAKAAAPQIHVEQLVSGLSIPWGIAFAPDGTMLFTERAGRLSVRLADGTVRKVTADLSDLRVATEIGFMAIVVDPGFATNRRFYTCQGHTGNKVQVIAWTMNAEYTVATRVVDPLVDGIPGGGSRHSGCRLRFGPDDYLWIATEDATTGSAPQSLANLGGKVLRVVASTGAGAPGNPFSAPNSPLIYSYGHRNPQGLALRPGAGGQMWLVEHGPAFDDEINLLTAGGNYGWDPVPDYNESTPMTDPEKFPSAIEAKWSSGNKSLAASGGIFLEGAWWGPWDGRLAVASLKDKTLRVLEFSPSGDLLSEISVSKLKTAYGRLRTPMMGPDDALYVSTSEGNGADKILRVTPQVAPGFPDTTDTTWDTPEHADITTIVATDPNSLSSKVTLTITVTNEDDAGAITLSSRAPVVGVDLTASVTDPDGGVTNIVWTWSKSSDQTTWTAIAGATSSTYRPVAADVGSYLRATAAYTDSQGSGNSAQQKTDAPVAAASIGVSVSETALTVAEGTSATYTVVLDGQPASDVVIEVTSNNSDVTLDTDAAASGNQHRLTFTTANWDTAQTVTVRAAQDADAANDEASITHAVVAAESADEYDTATIAGVAVTVTDDDTAGVTVSETTLTLAEGGSATYTVVLDTQPSVDVLIRIDNNNRDVKVDANATIPGLQPGMFFTPSNWNTPQTVMVSAAQDADAANDKAQLSHAVDYVDRSGGPYSRVVAVGVAVTVTDDDAGVTVSETALTVTEGDSATYTVVLDAQPASDVVVRITAGGSSDVTVSPAPLTFTPSNWSTAKTVTVRAAHDADAVNDAASISHAVVAAESADEFDAATIAGVTVSVSDDDSAGVTVSASTLTVTEGGSAIYTVVLDVQPTSDVVVRVTAGGSSDVTLDTDTGTSGNQDTLTFTTSNWDTAKTVTVRAAQDADAVNDTASITHAVDASRSADEFDNVTIAGLAVTVADDDLGVTNSESTLAVTEGGSATYTVTLTTKPSADVTIVITNYNPDVTTTPARLTFTPSNWNTPRTVTVAAAHDADAVNDKDQLLYTVSSIDESSPYNGLAADGVAVTVSDDETAGVTVSETTLTVDEGGNNTYTVVLDAQPVSNVVISVTKSGSADVTVSPATLTFTSINWDTAQTVTVSAAHDADAANDTAAIAHAVNASQSADEYDAAAIAGVDVTVSDDETAGVTVSETTLTVDEGGNGAYTVVLDAQPASDVVITLTSNNSDVTVDTAVTSGSQNTLTFTPSNWSVAQTVTVAADQDADAANDAASISHAVVASKSANEYDNVTIAELAVTVTDDEIGTAGVRSSVSRLSVAEGGSATYTVVLDAQPEARVRVWIVLISDGNVSRTPRRLDFTPSNWSTAQTVTLSATQDADTGISTAQVSYYITCASRCRPYNNNTTYSNVVEVIVVDDEVVGVTLPETTLTVLEGGNRTYTVVLNRQPTSDVVINVTKSGSDDLTATPASLTFTTSNWSTPQTVTVRAAQDADAANDTASITHAVVASRSANEYDAVSIAGVAVTVTDDETAGVTVSETTLTVAEGGSGAYTVVLDVQPTSDVVINVTKSGSDDVTVSPATLTFTTANWSTAQTVTVAAAQDADAVNDAASIAHAVDASRSANEYDNMTIAGVAVTVTDDDTAGVSVSETTLTVDEGGSGSYTVRLNTQPTSNVVISVTKTGSTDVTVSPATLTFTTSNWNTPQTVTVAAAQDADAVNDAASITHAVVASRSADEFDAVNIAGVAVTVTDDETAGVTVSKSTLTVAEGGSGAYTVVLDALPTSDVVISVTRTGSSDVTLDTDTGTSGNQTTLTFTPANWDTAQTVTVAAAQDADAVNDAASITHAVVASRSADEFDAVNIAGVAVTVTDDETAGVTVSKSTLTVDEGGSGSYTVVLNLQPTSDVVINVTKSGSSDVTPDTDTGTSGNQTTLTFTRANWDTAQTVTVAAAQDADAVDGVAAIAHAVVAAQSANEYDAVSIAGVAVTVTDNDAGVTVSPATLRIPEGNSSTYTVVLDALPASGVVITVSSDNSDVTVSPATLTFTPSNWSTAKTVTVAAAQDADAVNDAASITHAVVASRSADEFDAVNIAGVAVTVTDDETAGVTVSKSTLTVAEGGSGAYTVVLDALPTSDVVISVTRTGSSDVTLDTDTGTSGNQTTLTFTTANWSTAQTVTVRAAQDADAVDDAASISHAVVAARSANEFDLVTVAGVTVTVDDDDTAGVTVYPTSYNTFEDTANSYTVKLDAQPSSDVVIRVTSTGSSDVTVDTDRRTSGNQDTLTYTPSNWSTVQRVWVLSAADDDAVNDVASISHAVVAAESADEYDNVMIASFAVTVTDDETAGVTVSETTLTVAEGGSATYTVVLDAQPTSDVVINVTKSGSTGVTVSPATLTFTTSNWSMAQTVTVAAAQDADAVDDAAAISHAVDASRSANEYDNVSIAGVAVTVTDDETAGVTVSETALTVDEGGSGSYTVRLNTQPTSNVVISVTKTGSTDVTLDTDTGTSGNQTTLTFTTSNWNTPQTVTVAAAQDADAVNDAASITHAVVASRSADEFDAVNIAGVAVTVTDDETAGVTVSKSTLTVAEGGSGAYTVVLDALPTSDVVISVTRTGSSDVTLDTDTGTSGNQTTLTFTTANWSTAQTVTVAAAQDADAVDDAASITHAVVASRSADEFDAVNIAGVAVAVTDDETAGVTVSKSTLTVAEGGSGAYTVVLDALPTSDVVISVTRTGSSDVTLDTDTGTSGNQTTLTFTTANWSTAQTVTVAAAQDADAVDDAASITHAVVASRSADEFDAVNIAGVAVAVTDDETAGVSVSETALEVAEGGSATYTVVLDAQPTSDVVINVTKSGSSDVTVSPATLTFTTSNWSTAKTVTVAAAEDADAVDDAASIAHAVDAARSANEYDNVSIAGVAVTVTDDETAGVTVSETTLTVAEGGSATYTVVLNLQPTSDVVINVTKSGSTGVTVSPATLTFTTSNWSMAQTVTVAAAQDADAVDDAAAISHAVDASRSANEYDNVSIAGVAVTVTDDETAGVTVSETALTVDEGGSGSYTVRLNTQPTSNVVISVTKTGSTDVTLDTDTGTSGNQTTLTFTPANWSAAQTVTVRAAQDADAVNDAASITHAVVASRSADEFDAVNIAGVAVTVTDDETAGVTVSKSTLTVAEGGSGAYTVVLDALPTSDVVISVTRTGSSDVTLDTDTGTSGNQTTLTFTTANWSTAQTVTVAAAQDADAVDDAASITHAVVASRSADEFDAVNIAGVAVAVTDDETAGVSVSETALEVAEGGSGSYTVRLNTQPTSNVVISVTKTGSTDVTLDTDTGTSGNQTTLTFTPANWDTAQTVTVAAAQDADAVNDAASIAHAVDAARSANEYDNVSIAGVAVTVTDDETAGVTVSETTLTVAEGGSATYTVVLDAQPTSDVVINVTKSGSSDVTVSPATLTFTTSNWSTAKTVTVAAAEDADAVDDAASIAHAVDAARSANEYDNVSIAGVAVTVTDDETAGVTVSETTLTVAEGGSATYTVVLNLQPTSDVVINVTKSGSTDVTVSPATLTFTTSNWSTAQTVTVAAAQDADAVDDAAAISHAVDASRSANEYDNVSIAGVAVTVTDDETAGVTVSETALTVDEGGSGSYTVRLNTQPTSNVVISVTKTGSTDVTLDTDTGTSGNQTTLTFTPANWSAAQTVTVRAAQDADAVNDAASITHAVVASRSADEFDAVNIAGVAVTVTDDETAGVTVSKSTLTVAEGGSGAYTVVLDALPTSDVVISVTRTGSSDVTLDTDTGTSGNQTTLTFTTANWSTAQTVTVAAAQDADAVDDAASITHAVVASRSADEFDAVNIAGVAVAVTDDETAGVSVSETALEVAEGGSGSYTVRLNTQPTSNVVISVTKTGSTDVTLDTDTGTSGNQTTLTFTPANWDTAQTVTVAAAQDADAVNDAASIAHAVDAARSANEYDNVSIAGVAVTVTDDETAGVTVSETTLTVAEGGSATYTVVLDAQPTSDVVINVTKSGSSDVTVSPATLTFTTSNWSTAKTVTVAAAEDADAVDDAASIAHAVDAARSANEYDNVSIAGVAVTVTDDETAGVTVSETTLTVAEGGSATYTVVLNLQPTSDVVINVTKSGSTDVTVSPATLTFTTSNWSTAQTVTVAAAQDADAVDDAAAISHAVDASRSANEYDNVSIAGVTVAVDDDDTAGVTVSAATLTVAEGGSGTYTVTLNTQPASDVVISVTKTGSTDVTLDTDTGTSGNQTTLTFTPANWSAAQTVTVRAAQDADAVNDAASIAHAVVAAQSANEYDGVTVAGVTVTVTDDDTPPPTGGGGPPTGGGGPPDRSPTFASRTVDDQVYTVGEDVGTVSLPPALGGDGRLQYSLSPDLPEGLRFNSDRTITGTPGATFTRTRFTYTATDSDGDRVHLRFYITVSERPGVSVSAPTVTVTEGGSGTYTVKLNLQPTSDVVINVTKSGSSDVTVSPARLTFTTANWSTAQTVTVAAAQDDDAVNDTAAIAHAVVAAQSANEYDGVTVAGVTVTVTDDDTPPPTGGGSPPTGGGGPPDRSPTFASRTVDDQVYTVGEDVGTVSLPPALGGDGRLQYSLSPDLPEGLRFNSDRTITGTPGATFTRTRFTYTATDSDGDRVHLRFYITVSERPGVSVSAPTVTVTEGGSGTYTVKLNLQPTSDVVINVTKSGSSDVTVSPARLTFTTANWSTAQTVTVAAAQDADAVDDAASITHAVVASRSADEFDAVNIAGVAVAVTDDETAGVSVSETALEVAEGGSGSYTVRLNTQPTSNVVISVTKTGSTDVTLDTDTGTSGNQTTLTFTPANWDTAQTVTVAAAQDADAVNDAASIAHAVDAARSANEYDNVSIAGVAVTVTDDETAGVTVSETTLTVAEGGSATYTVVLDAQPTSDVVINVTKSGSTDVTVSPATLTFTTSNWSTAQTVTVAAAQDADAVDDAAAISHAVDASRSANEYDNVSIAGVTVAVDDDDTAGVTVSAATLTVAEGGSGTYTVTLNTQPASDVVISVTKTGSTDVTLDTDTGTSGNQTTLTFTPANWSAAQTVTVRAAQDADAVNDAASIAHAVVAAQSANEYDGVTVAGVTVTVTDDDTPPPTGGGSPPTGGGGPPDRSPTFASRTVDDQVYTVGEDVGTVSLPPALGGDGRLQYSLSPDLPEGLRFNSDRTITGTPGATFTRTRFTYTATDSDGDRVHLRFYITVSERPGVSVSAPTVTVTEGGSGTYTVKLNLQPTSDVVINVTRSGSADVTASPATLTFTPGNWSTAQTVRVAAAEDDDAANDTASIAHAVVAAQSANEYDAVTIGGVAVTVTDDDTAGVTVSASTLTVVEGGNIPSAWVLALIGVLLNLVAIGVAIGIRRRH